MLSYYPPDERKNGFAMLREMYSNTIETKEAEPRDINFSQKMAMFDENPQIADMVVAELGININELITFTDENGNPC